MVDIESNMYFALTLALVQYTQILYAYLKQTNKPFFDLARFYYLQCMAFPKFYVEHL